MCSRPVFSVQATVVEQPPVDVVVPTLSKTSTRSSYIFKSSVLHTFHVIGINRRTGTACSPLPCTTHKAVDNTELPYPQEQTPTHEYTAGVGPVEIFSSESRTNFDYFKLFHVACSSLGSQTHRLEASRENTASYPVSPTFHCISIYPLSSVPFF
ncbi:hypothetical protein C8J57DRAFT_1280721 [Mycena rebaudengoi]|nr:hypothetical protein C8J57DRAFT_1280721 [Mycena rebaudengoi]